MLLWTIKDYEEWEFLQHEGIYRGDPIYVEEHFRYPYSWYIKLMEKAVPRLPGVTTPVWAWYQYLGKKQPRPDLRHIRAWFPEGQAGVRITLEVPDELVLLSDFDTWHYVLNRWYLPRSEEEDILFEKELVIQGVEVPLSDNLPDQLRMKLEKSWENIFDLSFYWEYVNRPWEEKAIQATLWEIRLEWVVKMELFIGASKSQSSF